jgi:hypothetical protein
VAGAAELVSTESSASSLAAAAIRGYSQLLNPEVAEITESIEEIDALATSIEMQAEETTQSAIETAIATATAACAALCAGTSSATQTQGY